jgi:hypothetical protein
MKSRIKGKARIKKQNRIKKKRTIERKNYRASELQNCRKESTADRGRLTAEKRTKELQNEESGKQKR